MNVYSWHLRLNNFIEGAAACRKCVCKQTKLFGVKELYKWPKITLPKQLGSYPSKHTMSEVVLFAFCISQFEAE